MSKQIEAMKLALEPVKYKCTVIDDEHPDGVPLERWGQQPAQPQQEPVAQDWSVFNTGAEVWSGLSLADAVAELTPERMERGWSAVCVINKDNPPLYTSPQPSKPLPLTDEQMQDVVREAHIAFCLDKFPTFEEALIRKTEAAHGIKGDA